RCRTDGKLPLAARNSEHFGAREEVCRLFCIEAKFLETVEQISPITGQLPAINIKLIAINGDLRVGTICRWNNRLRDRRMTGEET
ncbi:MAG: hypothetical protein AAFW75_28270, partial [Cyanobacteria bacterium J06636_16]